MTDIMEIIAYDALQYAETGETKKLAEYLDRGGDVTPQVRAFLVKHLRGWQPKTKRRHSQVIREMRVGFNINMLMALNGLTQAEALRQAATLYPNLTHDTLKSYHRKHLKRIRHLKG